MYRRAGPSTDGNPYRHAWDGNEFDNNSSHLTPTLEILADRMRSKARYYLRMAERGGPRGREAQREYEVYSRISDAMRAKYKEVRKFK